MPDVCEIGTLRAFQAESNLSYHRARYYDPNVGRFLSEDPIRFDAGDENFYTYVRNDSVSGSDPSGLQGRKHPSPSPNPKSSAAATCPAPNCAVYVSCRGVQGHEEFAHCTVIAQNGSLFTAYDGGPSGSIWWSTLIIKSGPALPPGPNTWKRALPCGGPNPINIDCVKFGVDALNGQHLIYSFPFQNSNDAARRIMFSCAIMDAPIP
jgi:RHS repeat-associated protein